MLQCSCLYDSTDFEWDSKLVKKQILLFDAVAVSFILQLYYVKTLNVVNVCNIEDY